MTNTLADLTDAELAVRVAEALGWKNCRVEAVPKAYGDERDNGRTFFTEVVGRPPRRVCDDTCPRLDHSLFPEHIAPWLNEDETGERWQSYFVESGAVQRSGGYPSFCWALRMTPRGHAIAFLRTREEVGDG